MRTTSVPAVSVVSVVSVSLLAIALASGCLGEQLVPVAWSVPGRDIDIDGERATLERALCEDPNASSCRVLTALHGADHGRQSEPSLPRLMPRTFVVHETEQTIDVAQWLDEQRTHVHDILPMVAFSLEAGDLPAELVGLTISDASLRFDDDQLGINLPAFDVLVNGERVGLVGEHAGGSGAPAPLSLVDGGAAALASALIDGADIVLAPVDVGADAFLVPAGDELHRPSGRATVGFDLVAEVPVGNLVDFVN